MFFSLFCQTQLHLFCLNCSENAGVSFDRWRFQVFYGVSIALEVFLGQRSADQRRASCIGKKVGGELTPHHVTRHLSS